MKRLWKFSAGVFYLTKYFCEITFVVIELTERGIAMNKDLTAKSWPQTMEKIRTCHLSLIGTKVKVSEWKEAFDSLVASIKEERKSYPEFASEITDLTDATGSTYDFYDILEEYFDYLEENHSWQLVIDSCDEIMPLFKWDSKKPSEYMFRKGNALEKMGHIEEAEEFGQEWLKKYPDDLYAVASNVFLMIEMKRFDKAEELTKKYLKEDLICDKDSDTFFMAAYRLYEKTDDINAKKRVETKIAEYNKLMER